jgi:hypothetical protein
LRTLQSTCFSLPLWQSTYRTYYGVVRTVSRSGCDPDTLRYVPEAPDRSAQAVKVASLGYVRTPLLRVKIGTLQVGYNGYLGANDIWRLKYTLRRCLESTKTTTRVGIGLLVEVLPPKRCVLGGPHREVQKNDGIGAISLAP